MDKVKFQGATLEQIELRPKTEPCTEDFYLPYINTYNHNIWVTIENTIIEALGVPRILLNMDENE